MTEIHLSEEHKAFIEEQLKDGRYKSADEVVAAGLRLLGSDELPIEELRQLIQQGVDDVEAGRVHSYDTAEDFLADIKRVSAERTSKTGTGY